MHSGGSERMKFSDMVVFVGKNVPEQAARDAVKRCGARLTTNLQRPQSRVGVPVAKSVLSIKTAAA